MEQGEAHSATPSPFLPIFLFLSKMIQKLSLRQHNERKRRKIRSGEGREATSKDAENHIFYILSVSLCAIIGRRREEDVLYLFPALCRGKYLGHYHRRRLTTRDAGIFFSSTLPATTKGSKGLKLQGCHSNSPPSKRKVGGSGIQAACFDATVFVFLSAEGG